MVHVEPYTPGLLADLIARYSRAPRDKIESKRHCAYFQEYLSRLGARTVIIEPDYVDRDYLEDFSGYYVRCFQDYPRKCTRLHFLNNDVTPRRFNDLLEGITHETADELLKEPYLGFIVVKPLPNTPIGRTCLKAPTEKGKNFPILDKQKAFLCGFQLEVDSLPFQEQDSVVAACATSALWSAFQFTGRIFQHRVPTPFEITQLATENGPSDTRYFPTKGLTPESIAQAIRAVGLEPLCIQASNPFILMPTAYAYLRGRIPVFMSMKLHDPPANPGEPWTPRERNDHGVLLTGYHLGRPLPVPHKGTSLLLEANRLSGLYTHDDQVGPFCDIPLRWKRTPVQPLAELYPEDSSHNPFTFDTSWWPRGASPVEREAQRTRGAPLLLMIPLYHKIRIPYETIETIIWEFDAFLYPIFESPESMPQGAGGGLQSNPADDPTESQLAASRRYLTWDIHLTQGSEAKASILQEGRLLGKARKELMIKPLPRFVWRASARQQGQAVFDFLFDATDIHQGELLAHFIEYEDQDFSSEARSRLLPISNFKSYNQIKHSQTRALLKQLVERKS